VNFESRFEEQVVRPFVQDYLEGRTPIPCTLCNNFIKFDQFLDMAASVGAEKIATGHYARISRDGDRWLLYRSADDRRDQTYFLWGLTQLQLARTLFPLGGYRKAEVREIARGLGLAVADKSDSQEICFVPNGDYAAFIESYFREQGLPLDAVGGDVVDAAGRKLAEHRGVHRFTVGQRRGLKVAAGEALYVIATDAATRRVVVGRNDDLLRSVVAVTGVNWIAQLSLPVRADVKIRNKHAAAPATIHPAGDGVEVRFEEPQRAVTPGQAAVFYDGDLVLGGGWIESAC
jgi:tRNA-specific 2-thiouridylase